MLYYNQHLYAIIKNFGTRMENWIAGWRHQLFVMLLFWWGFFASRDWKLNPGAASKTAWLCDCQIIVFGLIWLNYIHHFHKHTQGIFMCGLLCLCDLSMFVRIICRWLSYIKLSAVEFWAEMQKPSTTRQYWCMLNLQLPVSVWPPSSNSESNSTTAIYLLQLSVARWPH